MNKKIIFKISLIAVFSAMTFGLTFISIPLPTGAKVHLGNFACTLAALLCGGLTGGLSGALGMGLNDLAQGYSWSTTLRTFIVKFIFGFTVGILFQVFVKKQKLSKALMYVVAGLFDGLFVVFLVLFINGQLNIVIGDANKGLTVSILCPILLGIIGVLLTIAAIFSNKLKGVSSVVLTVSAIGVLINTIMEFLLRWLFKGIEAGATSASFNASLVDSITKLPANFITGIATVVITVIIYLPLYKALVSTGYSKYIISYDNADENKKIED